MMKMMMMIEIDDYDFDEQVVLIMKTMLMVTSKKDIVTMMSMKRKIL